MRHLQPDDILTKTTRYNLIRSQRLIYIDIHEALHGKLAAPFVAVPNLINLIAKQEFQGVGQTETEALEDCLAKIKDADLEGIFPRRPPDHSGPPE
jgi:hypothetical protein